MNANKKVFESNMGYSYVIGCIVLTVYGQLILKWRVSLHSPLPGAFIEKGWFFARLLTDPFIISAFVAAFAASLFWMAAMTKFEVSYAYPFMSVAFVLVLLFGVVFLGEAITLGKVIGLALITAGIAVTVKM